MNKIRPKITATLFALVLPAVAAPVHAATYQFACDLPDFSSPLTFHWSNDGAILIGNMGHEEVTPIVGTGGAVTFVEVTPGGSVQVTAIEKDGGAVHGRHTMTGDGNVMESQVRGTCKREKLGV